MILMTLFFFLILFCFKTCSWLILDAGLFEWLLSDCIFLSPSSSSSSFFFLFLFSSLSFRSFFLAVVECLGQMIKNISLLNQMSGRPQECFLSTYLFYAHHFSYFFVISFIKNWTFYCDNMLIMEIIFPIWSGFNYFDCFYYIKLQQSFLFWDFLFFFLFAKTYLSSITEILSSFSSSSANAQTDFFAARSWNKTKINKKLS